MLPGERKHADRATESNDSSCKFNKPGVTLLQRIFYRTIIDLLSYVQGSPCNLLKLINSDRYSPYRLAIFLPVKYRRIILRTFFVKIFPMEMLILVRLRITNAWRSDLS